MRLAVIALGLSLVTSACTQNTGLPYESVTFFAEDENGSLIQSLPDDTCTTLPILLGSRVEERYWVDSALEAVVTADRDAALLEVHGATSPLTLQLTSNDLDDGSAKRASVQTPSGVSYTVGLRPGCN